MSKVVLLKIRSNRNHYAFLALLGLGLEMAKIVKTGGGQCVPLWLDHCLWLPIRRLTPQEVKSLLQPVIESKQSNGHQFIIMQYDEAEFPTALLSENYHGPGSYKWQRLTKKLFFSLSKGAHVQCTLWNMEKKNIFSARLDNPNNQFLRTVQWCEAVAVGAKNRSCVVLNQVLEDEDDPIFGVCL